MLKKILLTVLSITLGITAAYTQTKVIAHRGHWKVQGSAQNSLASFTHADKIKVFGSEIDVWYTGDNKLVVNHDRMHEGLDMTTATGKEIKALRLSNGEKIPTLDEYLKHVVSKPDTRLILEMKPLPDLKREDKAAKRIVAKLKRQKLLKRTDIISFSINTCLAFKKLTPESKIYYLGGELTPKEIKKLGLAGIDYNLNIIKENPQWVKEAHELGLEVNVWTVNNPADMEYFIKLGVDYITTDQPEELQKLLEK